MDLQLSGRTAWVTGSSRGIGRAIAQALAAEGANVVLHGRSRTNRRTSGEGSDLLGVAAEMARGSSGKDIAALATFLCGLGGEYVSGQLIRIDGAERTWPC